MLGAAGMAVITSLAGRTESPRLPAGAGQEARRGGFCGAAGLAEFLRGRRV
ncbi:MAG: cobalt-precorrin-6A reductase, partial [Gammaproteobacteria bacterium]|nr:cobalt-precorrin-6A reductase [Gammaproteobacteria bacterium]